MLKKTLINNVIALPAYVVATIAAGLVTFLLLEEYYEIFIGGIATLFYALCGFLLIPVKKLSFLSVVSVPVALTIMFLICVPMGEEGMIYAFLIPIGISLAEIERRLGFYYPDNLWLVMVILTHVLPALLFYLGMVLRKLIRSKKQSKALGGA